VKYHDTQTYDLTKDPQGKYYAHGKCSLFGGASDPMDSGATASGFSTKDHPTMPYVALPGPVRRKYSLPWGCRVTIQGASGQQVHGFLADTGPALETGRQIDLSPIFNTELAIETDDRIKFYVDPSVIDPRWTDAVHGGTKGPPD
jgi:3D (Asp-Asp-Asp) domain-containing protein